MRKLILRNCQSPGDILMLTAAVRDLHACYPNQFLTGVATTASELWENNPYITPIDERDPEATIVDCHYPLIHQSDARPYHFVQAFSHYLNEILGLNIKTSLHRGDIHLSEQEKSWMSQVHEITGEDTPFWIVAAGGKYDFTIKWWDTERYQQTIDHFRRRILFVQVGESHHYHPRLRSVIDLRGRTGTRQLVRLVHHAQGVLCGVTFLMHLAAAVETRPGRPKNRAAVIIAGGREPTQWESYPHHQFLHTSGALPCCRDSACWKSRTLPLGDGDEQDDPRNLCVNVDASLPRCMAMISPQDAIRRIEMYYEGGSLEYLTEAQYVAVEKGGSVLTW
jgi:ADP-heptose:LPS heptosyltransferase